MRREFWGLLVILNMMHLYLMGPLDSAWPGRDGSLQGIVLTGLGGKVTHASGLMRGDHGFNTGYIIQGINVYC